MLKAFLGLTSRHLTAEEISSRLWLDPTSTFVWPRKEPNDGDGLAIHQWQLTFDTSTDPNDDDLDAPASDDLLSAQLVALGPDVAGRLRGLVDEGLWCGLIMFDEIDLAEIAAEHWLMRRDYELSADAVSWLAAAGALTRVSLVLPESMRASTGDNTDDSEV